MSSQPEVRSMDEIRSNELEGAPARARNAGAGAPSGGAGPERRFSAQRKLTAVTRLFRGEPLETLARELNVTAARLSEWRDRALVATEAAMKERERDGRDEDLLRLKAKRDCPEIGWMRTGLSHLTLYGHVCVELRTRCRINAPI